MNHACRGAKGFTIVELLIVVLIIGILTVLAVVRYLKTVEQGRADQALSLVQKVGAANHMYSLDNNPPGAATHPAACATSNGDYPAGQITSACNAAACYKNLDGTGTTAGGTANSCDLVACGQLPRWDWDSIPYNVYALEPNDTAAVDTAACGFASTLPGSCYVACVKRKAGASAPYVDWGYAIDVSGHIDNMGGAAAP